MGQEHATYYWKEEVSKFFKAGFKCPTHQKACLVLPQQWHGSGGRPELLVGGKQHS